MERSEIRERRTRISCGLHPHGLLVLKYFKLGGNWSLFDGINSPSALR
jgi:hypothetical protein